MDRGESRNAPPESGEIELDSLIEGLLADSRRNASIPELQTLGETLPPPLNSADQDVADLDLVLVNSSVSGARVPQQTLGETAQARRLANGDFDVFGRGVIADQTDDLSRILGIAARPIEVVVRDPTPVVADGKEAHRPPSVSSDDDNL